MINYAGIIHGTWDPGGIPPFETPMDLYTAYPQAVSATRSALGLSAETLDFHLIGRLAPDAEVQREHWRVFYSVGGPSLNPGTETTPHRSTVSITASVYPHTAAEQVVGDAAYSMPYRGVFAGIIPALILRHRFGPAARSITLPSYGTGTFTPEKLSFPDLFSPYPQVTVPYATEGLASYNFIKPEGAADQPAMWLVTNDGSWKVSYCSESPDKIFNQRWDDPDEPAPEFEPLPAPEPVRPDNDF